MGELPPFGRWLPTRFRLRYLAERSPHEALSRHAIGSLFPLEPNRYSTACFVSSGGRKLAIFITLAKFFFARHKFAP
jgi:hypothetical protein